MTVKINAPWTMEQVAALQAYQDAGYVHPFTCGKRDDHPDIGGDRGVLTPTIGGWICQFCDYTQDWAHAFMFSKLGSFDAIMFAAGRPTLEQMKDKVAQCYQIAGCAKGAADGDIAPISDSEWVRAQDYMADEKAFDPDFLPWPRA